jgi:hypothetical protein
MNLYQVVDTEGNIVITGLSYTEALRYMQKNRMSRKDYSIELAMPRRQR